MLLGKAETEVVELIRAAFPFGEGISRLPEVTRAGWPLLAKTAADHGLAPLTYRALKRLDLLDATPRSAVESLRLAYVRTSVANQMAFRELSYWADYCRQEGIPLTVLKGGALARMLYQDTALRPMGDLDLLVPRAAVARVQSALIEHGYSAPTEMGQQFAERFSAERSFVRLGARPSQIDLHWHAFTSPYYFERIPIAWFWRRTDALHLDNSRALALSPGAQLLYLSAHYALHQYRRLIWSYDIARLIVCSAHQIDVDETIEAAAEFGLVAPLRNALAEVGEHWGTSIPQLAERLGAIRTSWKDRAVHAISRAPADGGICLPGGLNLRGVRKKLAYALRVLFPTPAYMRAQLPIRNRRMLVSGYLRRIGRAGWLIARMGTTLVLLAGKATLGLAAVPRPQPRIPTSIRIPPTADSV